MSANAPPPIAVDLRIDSQPFIARVTGNERTPTTLFSDCPITPSEEYNKVINPERRKLLFILALFVVITPLMFRYVVGSSNEQDVNSADVKWGSDIDGFEWTVLVVLWLGMLGSIMRLLPVVSGRPSAIESSQKCSLDGIASLGLCSPFSSEDDAILLRSLLGRTCTAFHTVGSRHSFQGLYVDTILNERRIKGEAYRRNVWLAWMKFMNSLVDVCLLIKEQQAMQHEADAGIELATPGNRTSTHDDDHDLFCASMDSVAPYRALYVEGVLGKGGVPAAARSRQYSIESAGSVTTPRKPATFRDIGAVFDASSGVSDAQHQRLRDWQQAGTPLSAGMALASPARIQASPFDHRSANSHRAGPRRATRISTFSTDDNDGGDKRLNRILSKIAENAMEEENEEEFNLAGGMDSQKAGNRGMQRLLSEDSELDGSEGTIATFSHDIELTGLGLDRGFSGDLDRLSKSNSPMRRSPRARTESHEHSIHSTQGQSPRVAAPSTGGSRAASQGISPLSVLTIDILDPSTWLEPASAYTEKSFPISATPQARGITPRQAYIAASYTRPHGISNLELNMADLVPMISFLDGWLAEMQENEWTYDYHNPK